MSSKSLVIEILNDSHTRSIDFDLAGFHVNPSRFAGVLGALRHGRIGVPDFDQLTCDEADIMSTCAYARYYFDTNEIIIDPRRVRSIYGRSAVVHECVHAIHDMYRAEATTKLSSEVAAFIAQCLYLRRNTPRHPSGEIPRGGGSNQRCGNPRARLDVILNLANDLVLRFDLERQPGRTIPHSDFRWLRRAVADAYPNYGSAERVSRAAIGVPSTQARTRPPRCSWWGGEECCSIG